MPCQTDRGDYSAAPPYRLIAPRSQEKGSPRRVSQCPGVRRPGKAVRRGGRVAEGARLESVFTGNRNVGSNPTPSATANRQEGRLPKLRQERREAASACDMAISSS